MTVLATFISLTIPSAAGANPPTLDTPKGHSEGVLVRSAVSERVSTRLMQDTNKVGKTTCRSARAGLRWYITRANHWLGKRGVRFLAASPSSTSCRYTQWLAHRWKARSWQARQAYERFQERRYVLRDFEVAPGNRAWLRAVREAQGPFPGTSSWLRSCSASEGGWGRWVPNSQGSGVGGWLQMFPSTFWRMFTAAKADAERRGFRVPSSAASWYSPIGQALGGAWAIQNGRRHEWVGHGC